MICRLVLKTYFKKCHFLSKSPVTYQNVCAGSILSPWVIISAAHCFYQENEENPKMHFLVVPNVTHANVDTRPFHKWAYPSHEIQDLLVHENFDYTKGKAFDHHTKRLTLVYFAIEANRVIDAQIVRFSNTLCRV